MLYLKLVYISMVVRWFVGSQSFGWWRLIANCAITVLAGVEPKTAEPTLAFHRQGVTAHRERFRSSFHRL